MSAGSSAKYPSTARQVVLGDLGRRVTIRSAVPGGFSDTIGFLEEFTEVYAELRRANGDLVRLPQADIVASRVVRPA